MADIFISYARSDRPRVKPIADRLAALGYQVWWDREIVAGAEFVEDINRELDQARVVLVAWSRASLNSVWVFGESLRALETERLVQIVIEPVKLNVPFNAVHYAAFPHDPKDEDWEGLKAAIEKKLGPSDDAASQAEAARTHGVAAPPVLRSARLVGLISTAATIGLALLVGAFIASMFPAGSALAAAGRALDSLPSQFYAGLFGAVTALAGASLAISAQRVFAARAGG